MGRCVIAPTRSRIEASCGNPACRPTGGRRPTLPVDDQVEPGVHAAAVVPVLQLRPEVAGQAGVPDQPGGSAQPALAAEGPVLMTERAAVVGALPQAHDDGVRLPGPGRRPGPLRDLGDDAVGQNPLGLQLALARFRQLALLALGLLLPLLDRLPDQLAQLAAVTLAGRLAVRPVDDDVEARVAAVVVPVLQLGTETGRGAGVPDQLRGALEP